jgi:SAM-dependent methyltransferase
VRIRPVVAALRARRRPVLLGSLGRTTPIDDRWGRDRGTPVDRWYIERFLAEHRGAITGRVLEVKDSSYTDRFGHDVTERAVLDIDPANERATHVADLGACDEIPETTFDCFVLTQTLQFVWDVHSAVRHAHRILSPGGVLLATVPVTNRINGPPEVDLWRFTPDACRRLFGETFAPGRVDVQGRGNVLTQVAFLHGLAAEDLAEDELAVHDEMYPLLVCVRAERAR